MASLPDQFPDISARSKKTRLFPLDSADSRDIVSVLTSNRLILPVAGLIVILLSIIMVAVSGLQTPGSTSITIGLGVTGLLLAALILLRLRKEFLKPLDDLRSWSQHLRAGNLAIRVPVPGQGEFIGLIRDINELTDELNVLTEEMDTRVRAQTEHIASKSRSLEILYDIATDLSTTRNLDELLEQFLDTMMVLVDAHAASVRLLTDKGQTFLVVSRGLTPEVAKQEQLVDVNRCLCGRIAQDGGIGIQEGIAPCNAFLDRPLLDAPCSELIVVPLQYRDRILGVYNLFLSRPSAELGKDVRDLLNSIGKHLGLAVEKARLDDNERRLAIMEERNLIGSELHDSLAQSLVSMRLQVKLLGETLHNKDIHAARNEVRRLRAAVEEAHASLRDLLANFRSRMDERGLIPSIEDLVMRFKQETGIAVFLQNQWHEFSFTPAQEIQVFRIVQESLANIRKHSNARTVRILLGNEDGGRYSVLIEDDGLGMPDDPGSGYPGEKIGLSIMRERAERLHGDLIVESEPGEGTRIFLVFPAQPAPPRAKVLGEA